MFSIATTAFSMPATSSIIAKTLPPKVVALQNPGTLIDVLCTIVPERHVTFLQTEVIGTGTNMCSSILQNMPELLLHKLSVLLQGHIQTFVGTGGKELISLVSVIAVYSIADNEMNMHQYPTLSSTSPSTFSLAQSKAILKITINLSGTNEPQYQKMILQHSFLCRGMI